MAGYAILIYGVLVLLGGVLGYAKAQSKPSLISGVVFGVLLLVSGWLMLEARAWGWYLAIVLAGFLTAFFAFRFKNTRKFMPAGLMVVLSVAAIAVLLLNPLR